MNGNRLQQGHFAAVLRCLLVLIILALCSCGCSKSSPPPTSKAALRSATVGSSNDTPSPSSAPIAKLHNTAAGVVRVMWLQLSGDTDATRLATLKAVVNNEVHHYTTTEMDEVCRAVYAYIVYQESAYDDIERWFAFYSSSPSPFHFSDTTRQAIAALPLPILVVVNPSRSESEQNTIVRPMLATTLPAHWRENMKGQRTQDWQALSATYLELLGRQMPTQRAELHDTAAGVVLVMLFGLSDTVDAARLTNVKAQVKARLNRYSRAEMDEVCRAVDAYLAYQESSSDDVERWVASSSPSEFHYSETTRQAIAQMALPLLKVAKPSEAESAVNEKVRSTTGTALSVNSPEEMMTLRARIWQTQFDIYAELLGRQMPAPGTQLHHTACLVIILMMLQQSDNPDTTRLVSIMLGFPYNPDVTPLTNMKASLKKQLNRYSEADKDVVCRDVDAFFAFWQCTMNDIARFHASSTPSLSEFHFSDRTRQVMAIAPEMLGTPDALESRILEISKLLPPATSPTQPRQTVQAQYAHEWKGMPALYSELLGRQMPTQPASAP